MFPKCWVPPEWLVQARFHVENVEHCVACKHAHAEASAIGDKCSISTTNRGGQMADEANGNAADAAGEVPNLGIRWVEPPSVIADQSLGGLRSAALHASRLESLFLRQVGDRYHVCDRRQTCVLGPHLWN